jgi:hypothetical protein
MPGMKGFFCPCVLIGNIHDRLYGREPGCCSRACCASCILPWGGCILAHDRELWLKIRGQEYGFRAMCTSLYCSSCEAIRTAKQLDNKYGVNGVRPTGGYQVQRQMVARSEAPPSI